MINEILRKLVRGDIKGNPANYFRNKRARLLIQLLGNNAKKNLRILDIGGTDYFWETIDIQQRQSWKITLLNNEFIENKKSEFNYLFGNALDLSSIDNSSFDFIYSNSVIEHVGNFEAQKQFANQVLSFNKPYFIQTPNYYFPFEPHFLVLGFHFLPVKIRAFLIRHFNLGWYKREKDYHKSLELATSIRLMKLKELKLIFPNAKIIREKILFLTKSFIVHNM